MMLAFVDEHTILLERQYRYPKHRHFIELPAGKLEPGEASARHGEARAHRGVRLRGRASGGKVTTLDPCIGYSNEVIHLFAARGLTHVGAKLDVGEHLETFEAKIDDAARMGARRRHHRHQDDDRAPLVRPLRGGSRR